MTKDQDHPNCLVDFFQRYQTFREQTEMLLWKESELAYSGLIKRFIDERPKAMEAESLVSSDYNLFSILKLNFSEVRLHTPILANLLDPTGSHAQGLLFYKLFIQTSLTSNRKDRFLDVEPYELEVSSETRNPYGQIDIFLYSSNPNNRFAIIIENKIRAGDQFRQLYRYYQYANEALGLSQDQICVVYLKPKEGEPDMSGLNSAEQAKLNSVLVKISYRDHIVPVLHQSIASIKSEKVKQTILQYLLTLNSLPI